MQGCRRGPAPALLATHGLEIGAEYARRRRDDPAHSFRWPQRGGESLYEVARRALADMTAHHCSYCDGFPLDATGTEEIDHFRPKTHEAFYELVCTWENLFLTCVACNRAKRDCWDPALLRPDDLDYAFDRYFLFRFDTGALEPAPDLPEADRHRALRTLTIFDLNRTGACRARLTVVKSIDRWSPDFAPDDRPYRFLMSPDVP